MQRIQLQRIKGYRKPENAIAITRPGKWGNPFKVGDQAIPDAAAACRAFEQYLLYEPDGQALLAAARRDLAGHDLACWCPLDQPCHGDVYIRLIATDHSPSTIHHSQESSAVPAPMPDPSPLTERSDSPSAPLPLCPSAPSLSPARGVPDLQGMKSIARYAGGYAANTILRWIKSADFPAFKSPGNEWVAHRSEIDRWWDKQRQTS